MEKAKMIEEAVRRMRILKLSDGPKDSIIRLFEEEGKIYKSVVKVLVDESRAEELYALTEAEKKLVRDFEKRSGYLVYYVLRNEMIDPPIGVEVQYSLFFVSDKENEWEQDREDITGIEPYIMFPNVYAYTADAAHADVDDLSGGRGKVTKIGIPMSFDGFYRIME